VQQSRVGVLRGVMPIDKFYFDHDQNARNDQKVLKLRARHGLEGYGFFWCLIEMMSEDTTGYLDGCAMAELSLAIGLPVEKITVFIETLLEIGLIKKCDHGNLFNDRILEHKAFRAERSASGKKGALNKWKNHNVNSSAIGSVIEQPMASKEIKERKGNKTKDSIGDQKTVFWIPGMDWVISADINQRTKPEIYIETMRAWLKAAPEEYWSKLNESTGDTIDSVDEAKKALEWLVDRPKERRQPNLFIKGWIRRSHDRLRSK
jgi:hypothetical protein